MKNKFLKFDKESNDLKKILNMENDGSVYSFVDCYREKINTSLPVGAILEDLYNKILMNNEDFNKCVVVFCLIELVNIIKNEDEDKK